MDLCGRSSGGAGEPLSCPVFKHDSPASGEDGRTAFSKVSHRRF